MATRNLLKFVTVFVAAVLFSLAFVVAHGLAHQDALADFLDASNQKAVRDYLENTEISRVIGCVLILMLWSGVVVAIDRGLDSKVFRRGDNAET